MYIRIKKKIYFKILISMVFIVVLTAVAISSLLSVNFERAIQNQVFNANVDLNKNMNAHLSQIASSSLYISNQIYHDISIERLLYLKDPSAYDIVDAFNQLSNYRMSIPSIESIYIYNSNTDTLYVQSELSDAPGIIENISSPKADFFDKSALEVLKNYKNYKPYLPITRGYIPPGETRKSYYYTFIMYNAYTKNLKDSLVMVNFSKDWLSESDSSRKDNVSRIFAVNPNGVIVSSNGDDLLENVSNESYIKKVLSSKNSSGFLISYIPQKSLIVYTKSELYDWSFISIIPWKTLSSNINRIILLTILLALSTLGLLIFLAFVISGKLYTPIGKILADLKSAKYEQRTSESILRRTFLKDVILGQTVNTKEFLETNFKKYGIDLEYSAITGVILLRIDDYIAFAEKFNLKEREAYLYAISNIAEEILKEQYKAITVETKNDTIAVLANVPDLLDQKARNLFTEQIRTVQEDVKLYLAISVSVAVSFENGSLSDANGLYLQSDEALLRRFFLGYGCIVYSDEIKECPVTEYRYPQQKENQLVENLMEGKAECAKEIYLQIINELRNYPISVCNTTISRLILMANHILTSLQANDTVTITFYMNPYQIDVVDKMNRKFFELFDRIYQILNKKKNEKYDNIISRINQIINTEYMKSNLCVDYIADKIGISVSHMCRLYKQFTCKTILQEILDVRISRAKELLMKSKASVNEVSDRVGFSSASYFHKAFKKATGKTPIEYRKMEL